MTPDSLSSSPLNRRKQAVEDLAVKPVTQFPVEISNEDAFASFKNVRHVTIKKVIASEALVDEPFHAVRSHFAVCRATKV